MLCSWKGEHQMTKVEDMLGVDAGDFQWTDLAACKGLPPQSPEKDWFFDGYETNKDIAKTTDQMCNACPVQRICGEYAIENRLEGCWGGIYWTPQGKPDAVRNNHKQPKDWKGLERVYGRPLM